jgi:hypothetical protein
MDGVMIDAVEIEWSSWDCFVWLRIGTSSEFCESDKEPSGSIKCWETVEWLHN